MVRRRLTAVGVAFGMIGALACAAAACAAAAAPAVPPARGGSQPSGAYPANTLARASAQGPIVWNGGPIMRAHTVYLVAWTPVGYTVSGTITHAIGDFFRHVSAAQAAGAKDNTYGAALQYCGSNGSDASCDPAAPRVTWGGGWYFYQPYSQWTTATMCGSNLACTYEQQTQAQRCAATTATCVTDLQVQSEAGYAEQYFHWPGDLSTVIFMMMPPGVQVCDSIGCTFGSGAGFCAFHNYFQRSDGHRQVYAMIDPESPVTCHEGDIQSILDVTSHEHIESITDPYQTAWHDQNVIELADPCTHLYGPDLAGDPGYNQIIDGASYELQMLWGNAAVPGTTGGCIQGGIHRLSPSFSYSGTPAAGRSVTMQVPASIDRFARITSYTWDLGDGTRSTAAAPSHIYSAARTYAITLTVRDADGSIGTVAETLRIGPPPPARSGVYAWSHDRWRMRLSVDASGARLIRVQATVPLRCGNGGVHRYAVSGLSARRSASIGAGRRFAVALTGSDRIIRRGRTVITGRFDIGGASASGRMSVTASGRRGVRCRAASSGWEAVLR